MSQSSGGAVRRGPIHDVSLVELVISGQQRRNDAVIDRFRAAETRLGVRAEAEALKASSPARVADLVAQGRRALCFGIAVATVVLAIGVAVRLALHRPATDAAPTMPVSLAGAVAPPPNRPDIIVRDYVIFSEAKAAVGGKEYLVQAGHRFESERAASFSAAWCYTERIVDGVDISLTLGNLDPGASPRPADPVASMGSWRAMGLREADVVMLFRTCPWLQVEGSWPK